MKRILFISLSNLLLLTACGTSASKNIPSDTQISNSIDSTISTNEKFSGRNFRYKSFYLCKKQGKETVSTSPLFQTNSELASSSSSANNDDSFAFTPN